MNHYTLNTRHWKRWKGLWLLGLLLLCAQPLHAQRVKTLVFCPAAVPSIFNPQLHTIQTDFDASAGMLYDRLLAFEPGTTRVQPALAEAWEITENGRVYTFRLRQNVKFHSSAEFQPTRTFNADDVVFSFERQWRKNHPYHRVSGGQYDYFTGMLLPHRVLALDQLDDYTLQFTLKQADAGFPAVLAMPFASILSAEYANWLLNSGQPELLDQKPIGTGPFRLLDATAGQRIIYQAHDDYWAGRATLDQVIFAATPDPAERISKLARGECHVLPPQVANVAGLQRTRGVKLLRQPALDVAYLAFNTRQAPLDNTQVRLALTLAIDKEAILQVVYGETGIVAKNPLPPSSWAYHENLPDHPYDPARARELLTEAGLADGFKTQLWAMPVKRAYNPNAVKVAELIRADWALLGIEAEIVVPPWDEFLSRSRAAEHGAILLGWQGDNGDPDNFLTPLLSCTNVGGSNRAQWCDSEFEGLLRQARIVTELDKRTQLYQQAQEIFKQQMPFAPLAHSVLTQPVRQSLRGFVQDVFGGSYFYGVEFR